MRLQQARAALEDAMATLEGAISQLKKHSHVGTDGRWLEDITADVAPHIREWNVGMCWKWEDWPERDDVMPDGTPSTDVGIDLVARRRDDSRWIAIQAKARKLDLQGKGSGISSGEINKFLSAAANSDIWAERWLVVNGDVALAGHSPGKVRMSGAPLKMVNIAKAVETQRMSDLASDLNDESCPHCDPHGERSSTHSSASQTLETPTQTRSCMQREAVRIAVAKLRDNEHTDEENIPRGEARGRIVLPCGTGKTRIALRITEELTYPGDFSVVLCPSIALVAQIRREFLQHTVMSMRALAVCSDQGVAADAVDEDKVANNDDATLDRGLITTEEIKGCHVTTDADEIANWIRQRRKTSIADSMTASEHTTSSNVATNSTANGNTTSMISVIFGTYQSAQRISEGIRKADAADAFKVLICDEAHRTAGVSRRKRSTAVEKRLREFTLCHDREAFPATYRVYQTATPRIYGDTAWAAVSKRADSKNLIVREMDDQATFGVELYRRSYAEAVKNGWLSDYRIIAMGVGGKEAMDIANQLVTEADEQTATLVRTHEEQEGLGKKGLRKTSRTRKSRLSRAGKLPTTGDYLKGMAFALAMGGAARKQNGDRVPLRSCIGFLNTIARSKAMTEVLQSNTVRQWVAKQAGEPSPEYRLEHLDASTPVAGRDEAKRRLASATSDEPHSVLNVGIFGEGTDSPSLSAVAFLEPRKSPIDVVQAVGRAMRRAEGKDLGYIVVPVVIPPGVDAERHLAVSDKHEGWKELGEILQALRSHDQRIEDALPEMLSIHLPPEQQLDLDMKTAVAVGRPDKTNLEYAVITGSREEAEDTARYAVRDNRPLLAYDNAEKFDEALWHAMKDEPNSLIVHVKRPDGSTSTRQDAVVRHKPKANQAQGKVNEKQTKRRAVEVSAGKRGKELPPPSERARIIEERNRKRAEREAKKRAEFETHIQGVLVDLSEELGSDIKMNLLEKSGLAGNKVERDLNLLADSVGEAARYLHAEVGLAAELDTHFGFDRLSPPKRGKPRADGATIAALLWMNAAMLHQRVYAGGWLGRAGVDGIDPLSDIKASSTPEKLFRDSWQTITRQDFLPVIDPAMNVLKKAVRTERLGGLRRALRHLATEAEQIAATYADMGTDHAGALFNEVMGDQSSEGAFFTRPVAADIAARLTLEAADPGNRLNWAHEDTWRQHKTIDLACGSGTLLAAVMTEMKRRAVSCGADRQQLANLQKIAVEETLKGLDINPVSLQLAATQLMSGNTDVKYRKMGLHIMPYGPQPDGSAAAGSLELFGRQDIVSAGLLFDNAANSISIETGLEQSAHNTFGYDGTLGYESPLEGPEMDDAAADVRDARIAIMNPPFTNRTKMGEKFDKTAQSALRSRMDTLEGFLKEADPRLSEFLDKNSLGPRFAALADLCVNREKGVFTTVLPTVALTNSSGLDERVELAKRFHIHTILTCYSAQDMNMSQHTSINESIVVMHRHGDSHEQALATRIISLDRFPKNETETDDLFTHIHTQQTRVLPDHNTEVLPELLPNRDTGVLPDGWGEISSWPVERIQAGDWSAVAWRSPKLADAAAKLADHGNMAAMSGGGDSPYGTDAQWQIPQNRKHTEQRKLMKCELTAHKELTPRRTDIIHSEYRKTSNEVD